MFFRENETVDLKEVVVDDIKKEIIAFANCNGGKLYIGVRDDGKIVIDKKAVSEDFFILSTGMAGEILQKYMNDHVKLAVYGDFSHYTSKPLRDFIYESNHGKDFFFVRTKDEAVAQLKKI